MVELRKDKVDIGVGAGSRQDVVEPVQLLLNPVIAVGVQPNDSNVGAVQKPPVLQVPSAAVGWEIEIVEEVGAVCLVVAGYRVDRDMRPEPLPWSEEVVRVLIVGPAVVHEVPRHQGHGQLRGEVTAKLSFNKAEHAVFNNLPELIGGRPALLHVTDSHQTEALLRRRQSGSDKVIDLRDRSLGHRAVPVAGAWLQAGELNAVMLAPVESLTRRSRGAVLEALGEPPLYGRLRSASRLPVDVDLRRPHPLKEGSNLELLGESSRTRRQRKDHKKG